MNRTLILFTILACMLSLTGCTGDGKTKGKPGIPYWTANNCARAVPEPVLKKIMLPDHSFSVDSVGGTGTETASFEGGKLTVTHSGCENTVYTYRIESPNELQVGMAVPQKYFLAVTALSLIEPMNEAPVDFRKAQEVMMAYAKTKDTEHALGEAMPIEEGSTQTVSLDSYEKVGDNHVAEVSFTLGTL